MKHGSVFRFTDFETYGDYPEGVDVEWPNLSILTEEAVALVGASPARIEKGIQEDETLAAVTHELTNSELLPKLKEMTGYEYHILKVSLDFGGFVRRPVCISASTKRRSAGSVITGLKPSISFVPPL